MRHDALWILWVLLFLMGTAQADTVISQQRPTIVYERRSTISAQPYYQRLKRNDRGSDAVVTTPDGAGVQALADRLPLSPSQLRVGQPQMKSVPGLITPLFILGMDEVSLSWFGRAAQGLSEMGARGIVVQASDRSAWRALQRRAREAGIDLMLLEGDAIARGYGISTYPTVLVNPQLAGEGGHE